MTNKNKFKVKWSNMFKYIILIIASFISVFPFIWMLIGVTNTSNDIISGKMTFGNHLLINIENAFLNTNLVTAIINSLKVSIFSVIFSVLVSAMAGYGFQMFKSRGLMRIYNIYILSMMIPFSALMIPQYILIVNMGLLNSLGAVILPAILSAFFIFFFYQSLENFPIDTIESARLDGASEILIFFRIVAPQLKSTFATAAIIAFMNSWNNYMWPLIVLQTNEVQTLPLIIASLSDASNYTYDYGVIMITIIVSVIPIFIIFIALQKYFIAGIEGSTKG